jgi:hypothetical protein
MFKDVFDEKEYGGHATPELIWKSPRIRNGSKVANG